MEDDDVKEMTKDLAAMFESPAAIGPNHWLGRNARNKVENWIGECMTNVYIRFAQEKGNKITHVFDTHLHADHISGGRKIAEKTGATYWLPPKDADEVTFSYEPLVDVNNVKIGQSTISIQALYTPGHTRRNKKTKALALEKGVNIKSELIDLNKAPWKENTWDAIVNIYGHFGSSDEINEVNGIQVAIDERVKDRKSTRLNSSHTGISYAVFCLKKKKKAT